MKKILLSVLLCLGMTVSAYAFPVPITPFSLNTPYGTNISATGADIAELDWLPGPGLAVNANPYAGTPDSPFEFLYQMHLGSIIGSDGKYLSTPTLNGEQPPLTGFPNPYEFTLVGRIWETGALGGAATKFDLASDPTGTKPNMLEIYADKYDGTAAWGTQVDVAAGTGYNDGLKILEATPVYMESTFGVSDTNGNSFFDNEDNGTGSSTIGYLVTWYDPNFFTFDWSDDPTGNSPTYIALQFDGTLTLPPEGTEAAKMWDGTIPNYYNDDTGTSYPNQPDFLFKIDGNTHNGPVPEPGTFILLGLGLLGASSFARRKKTA